MVSAEKLPPIDYSGFARALTHLRREIAGRISAADLHHLRRMERWGRMCTLLGYAMAPWFPNPLAALFISQGNLTRWLLMHHIGHRGYDKVPGIPRRYTSAVFAMGRRRFVDWFDWILPEAWNHEHNVLHHYHTGEVRDPDLVEENISGSYLATQAPMGVRYAVVLFFAMTWKISYYAPNTYMALENVQRQKRGEAPFTNWWIFFNPLRAQGRAFWRRCVLPYGLMRFAIVPALFLPFGRWAAACVLINSVLAEVLTNMHTFAVIAPNHAGDDVYRFDTPEKDKTEFYARQVLGSVNYWCGNDRLDFAQMWLNYQIEHHVWPDMPMLQYRHVQPRMRALCADYGVPYVQQSVFKRVGKLVNIMVGKTAMPRLDRVTMKRAANG